LNLTLKKKSYYTNGTLATIFHKIKFLSYVVKILTLFSKSSIFHPKTVPKSMF